jgi:NAD(P)-dependent dehydrogenase (short-subunit alcohol dehydrogenase family)
MVVEADVSRPDDVRRMIEAVEQGLGPIRILVNNAGTSERHPASEFPYGAWDSVLATNLSGPFLCAQAAFPTMSAAGGGSIINIASIAGIVGVPGTVAYSASKGGLVSLTRALAIEWASEGVRVNAICPCPVETDLSRRVFADRPDVFQSLVAAIPMGRVAQPEDLQGLAVFLASEASNMVTGAIIPVDGGYSAR